MLGGEFADFISVGFRAEFFFTELAGKISSDFLIVAVCLKLVSGKNQHAAALAQKTLQFRREALRQRRHVAENQHLVAVQSRRVQSIGEYHRRQEDRRIAFAGGIECAAQKKSLALDH